MIRDAAPPPSRGLRPLDLLWFQIMFGWVFNTKKTVMGEENLPEKNEWNREITNENLWKTIENH